MTDQFIGHGIRIRLRDALKRETVTRNRSCSESGVCRTFTVRPIGLDDEADMVIDTVCRVLRKEGWSIVPPSATREDRPE